MTRRPILLAAAIAVGALCQSNVGAQAPVAGDPVKGESIFSSNCSTCHTNAAVSPDSTTLSLFGIVGRKSASIADFSYSPAMQGANIVWTREKLNAYIENPPAVVPNNIMYFPGLPDPAQRADLIAYLASLK